MSDRIRIALVDDHPMLREGVAHILGAEADMEIIAQGGSAADALRIARDELPDVILLDVSMPGGGIEAARRIAETCPVVKIAMLTVAEDEQSVSAALRAGAHGYVLKGVSGPDLVRMVRAIHAGENYVSPTLAARPGAARHDLGPLEPRGADPLARRRRPEQPRGGYQALDQREDGQALHDQHHAEAASAQSCRGGPARAPAQCGQEQLLTIKTVARGPDGGAHSRIVAENERRARP
jgi:DNA-binding NarL/FixJ family response regulator